MKTVREILEKIYTRVAIGYAEGIPLSVVRDSDIYQAEAEILKIIEETNKAIDKPNG